MDMCMDTSMGMKPVAAENRRVAGFVVVGNRVRVFAGFVVVAGFPIQTLCVGDIGAPRKNILCTPLR
jgi:hypothetical protein